MPFVKWRRFMVGYGKGRAGFSGSLVPANVTQGVTASGVETTLQTIVLPKNSLYKNGMALRITAMGTFAATSGSKVVKLKFGGSTLVTTNYTTVNGVDWYIAVFIVRVGSKAQVFKAETYNTTDLVKAVLMGVTLTEDDTADLTIAVTGTAAASGDVIAGVALVAEVLTQ